MNCEKNSMNIKYHSIIFKDGYWWIRVYVQPEEEGLEGYFTDLPCDDMADFIKSVKSI